MPPALLALALCGAPPDTLEELNARLSAGVTAETNALAGLVGVYGPDDTNGRPLPDELFRRLGVPRPPRGGGYIVPFQKFVKPSEDRSRLGWLDRPWVPAEFPNVDAWLTANAGPLSRGGLAIGRPDFYEPIVSFTPRVAPNRHPELAFLLAGRANRHLGVSRADDAWADVMACRRLAWHVGRGKTGSSEYLMRDLDSIAYTATVTYAAHAVHTPAEWRARLEDSRRPPPAGSLADMVDGFARLELRLALRRLAAGGPDDLGRFVLPDTPPPDPATIRAIDAGRACEDVDTLFDRAVAALRLPKRPDRREAIREVLGKGTILSRSREAARFLAAAPDAESRRRQAAEATDRLIRNDLELALWNQRHRDEQEQRRRNAEVALALAAYRARTGRYPDALAELVPADLEALPADLFTGGRLGYRRAGRGCEVRSVGPDGAPAQLVEILPDDVLARLPSTAGDAGALNAELARGVSPETNAVARLWDAFGPGSRPVPEVFFQWLGRPRPPAAGRTLVEWFVFRQSLEPAERDAADVQRRRASAGPWVEADCPRVAAWLRANESPLAVAADAARRPAYFRPLAPSGTQWNETPHGLWQTRELGDLLAARSTLRLGERRWDDAWADLQTLHRLARLASRGGTALDALLGRALETIAQHGERAYLDRAVHAPGEWRARLADLRALPPALPLAETADLGERLALADAVRPARVRDDGDALKRWRAAGVDVSEDWAEAFAQALRSGDGADEIRATDRHVDRVVAALRRPAGAGRAAAVSRLEREAHIRRVFTRGTLRVLMGFDPPDVSPDPSLLRRPFVDLVVPLAGTSFGPAVEAERRVLAEAKSIEAAFGRKAE